jgi:hypothetical protein
MKNLDPQKDGVFKGPKTLTIMPTFQCTAQCADCGTFSSPYEHTSVNLETILSTIKQAKELGFANVVFTGGEATIKWDILLESIAYSHSLDLPTRVVTNAFWARSLEKARERIDALVAAGLDEINYSTGDEHVKYVPLEYVINAIIAAAERGFLVHIMVELRAEGGITADTIRNHERIVALPPELRALVSPNESPWMPIDPMRFNKYPPGIATDRNNLCNAKGCDSVLQTYVLQADGRIGSCCGLGMRITPELNVARAEGDDFLMRAIEEAESDFLKVWIRYLGTEKILAWAAEKNPDIKWEGQYAHNCQACLRIYKDPAVREVIREHYQEMRGEVLQAVWLDEVYIPQQMEKAIPGITDSVGTVVHKFNRAPSTSGNR